MGPHHNTATLPLFTTTYRHCRAATSTPASNSISYRTRSSVFHLSRQQLATRVDTRDGLPRRTWTPRPSIYAILSTSPYTASTPPLSSHHWRSLLTTAHHGRKAATTGHIQVRYGIYRTARQPAHVASASTTAYAAPSQRSLDAVPPTPPQRRCRIALHKLPRSYPASSQEPY
ncbi:hypothetical protein K438DRAFT_377227 [Mycena galopus ATCC 62051]|nr:hypothetical protein K438DRAFT_377227 [Mycena galopus ATCC 62051]